MRKTKFTNFYDVIRALHGNRLPVRGRALQQVIGDAGVPRHAAYRHRVDELRTMSPMNILAVRVFDPMQVAAYGAWTMARARCW